MAKVTISQDSKPISVGVVDDHPSIGMGLTLFFSSDKRVFVRWSSKRIQDALALLNREPVDVLIVDLRIADENGFELLASARLTPKVVYSAFHTETYVRRAFELGAMAFVEKNEPLENLQEAVLKAHEGVSMISDMESQFQRNAMRKELSKQELAVLKHCAQGMSNAQIADALSIREATVKSYMKRIFFKLDAHSRQHAAKIAIEKGLIMHF